MLEISAKSVNIYLDFNAVIVNLESLSPGNQKTCLAEIERNVRQLKAYIEENIQVKEALPEIPETAKAVLKQQLVLAQAIEDWLATVHICQELL